MLDSAVATIKWIEQQEKENSQILNISLKYYNTDSQMTVYKDLPKKIIV